MLDQVLAEWFSNADQLTAVLFLSSDTPSELVWGPYDAFTNVCVCTRCSWQEQCFILPRGSGVCLQCRCVCVCVCVWVCVCVLRVCLVCVGVESCLVLVVSFWFGVPTVCVCLIRTVIFLFLN